MHDRAAPALTAATPITPGRHAIFLSIFDQGDRAYDSAVFRIDELNDIIERNALRNGFRFTDPSPLFADHELCSGGEEWIFGIASGGRMHPTANGQQAIADALLQDLPNDTRERFDVAPRESEHYTFFINHREDVDGDGRLDLKLQFPTPNLDVRAGDTELCITGTLPDGRPFESCDSIRTVP